MNRLDDDARTLASVIDDLERSWGAAGGNSVTTERRAAIAGKNLLVRSPSAAMLDHMWPALEHHPAFDGMPDLELRMWSLPPGQPRPLVPTAAIENRELAVVDGSGTVIGRIAFENDRNIFMAWDARRSIAWWCADSITEIPWWTRAAPFKAILSWWLSSAGLHIAHVGCVVGDDGAVLLAGPSGSGKSTTAVTCHLDGMGFISDDLCLVSVEPEPMAHSLFGTAKLFPHEFDQLTPLHLSVLRDDRGTADKLVSVVTRRPGAPIVTSAPLVAIAACRIGRTDTTQTERASAGDVLTALAPSSLLPIAGTGATTLQALASIVRRRPCFRLSLGHDRPGVVAAVRALTSRASVTSSR